MTRRIATIDRAWIAWAPAGVPSTGPAVVYTAGAANVWRAAGWTVHGPYVLETPGTLDEPEAGIVEALDILTCSRCGAPDGRVCTDPHCPDD